MPIEPQVLSKYLSGIFIETGTGAGGGVESALKAGFLDIHSTEIDSELHTQVGSRLISLIKKDYPNINYCLQHGKSTDRLHFDIAIANDTHKSATFWLDAHINDNTRRYDAPPNPILQELDIIFVECKIPHVILIDDRRLFQIKGIPLWHNINEVEIHKHIPNTGYRIFYENGFVENDIIVIQHEEFKLNVKT